MDSNAPRRLKLGDEINATVVKASGGRRFLLKSNGVPNGWKVELHTRRPELVEVGAHTTFWIAKISPLQGAVLVHDGDFGRLPISDAMKPRYVAALKALLGAGEATADEIADARSMFVRIQKKDAADWLTVWRALGEPESGDVKLCLTAIDAVRTARKEAPEKVPAMRQGLIDKYGPMLRSALRRLER